MNATVTISTPGMDPVTTDLDTLKKAAKRLKKGFKSEHDPRQAEAFTAEERGEDAAEGVAAGELQQFIERIERLEEEKRAIADDIKDIFSEAKGRGFDTKALRTLVRLRAKEPHEREEEEAILELYKSAIGMA